jgi:hypothetical protein
MSQRQLLENSINLTHAGRGPAKLLYAPGTLPMPTRIEQIIDPTGGAAATGWTALGFTRSGINVVKRLEGQPLADADQIIGTYDTILTGRSYQITTQLAEVFDRAQLAVALETGTVTQVSTTGPTQVLMPLDSGSNSPVERRIAVVFPKATDGRAWAFVFRRAEITSGDKTLRFDRSDPVSPALEFLALPEIATSIPSDQAWGYALDVI